MLLNQLKSNIKYALSQLIFTILVSFLLYLVGFFPNLIEKYYSSGIYPLISTLLRFFDQQLHFSLGDCFYLLLGIIILKKIIVFSVTLYQTSDKSTHFFMGFIHLLKSILRFYIAFMLLWGLNYSRIGASRQFKVAPLPYSTEELCSLSQELIQEMNYCKSKLIQEQYNDSAIAQIYTIAIQAYHKTKELYPFLQYTHPAVKSSLYTLLAPYIGFTGYFNPFTGEAQVRKDLPHIMLPYITCHEIAHQLGYADESEASFIAWIVAEKSNNTYLRYSALIDLYRFTRMELFLRNTYPDGPEKLSPAVKENLVYIHNFIKKESFKQSETISNAYDMYLRMNGLEKGIESYNDIVAWVINWRKAKGLIR